MSRPADPLRALSGGEPKSPGRRPYEPPRILWREPLEAVAVVCSPPGKADVTSCPLGPITS